MIKAYSEKELADLLSVSVAKIRRDRQHGIGIPYVKYGRCLRYLEEDVVKYFEAHRSASRS